MEWRENEQVHANRVVVISILAYGDKIIIQKWSRLTPCIERRKNKRPRRVIEKYVSSSPVFLRHFVNRLRLLYLFWESTNPRKRFWVLEGRHSVKIVCIAPIQWKEKSWTISDRVRVQHREERARALSKRTSNSR